MSTEQDVAHAECYTPEAVGNQANQFKSRKGGWLAEQ